MAVNVFAEVARIFERVARESKPSTLTWLVKCKKRGDRDEVLERLGRVDADALLFEYDTPLFELFPRSRVVIGYNSLALVEAMLTDAPVVVPCWGEARAERHNLLLDYNDPLTRRVVTFADSPQQLEDLLSRAARGEKLPTGTDAERRAMFRSHVHIPDGRNGITTASGMTEAFIRHFVERARARAAA